MLERALRPVLRTMTFPSMNGVRKHTMLERALRLLSDTRSDSAPIASVRKHTMLERALRLYGACFMAASTASRQKAYNAREGIETFMFKPVASPQRRWLRQKAYNAREGIETPPWMWLLRGAFVLVRKHTMLERALRQYFLAALIARRKISSAYNAREGIETMSGVGIRAFVEICVRRRTLQP